MFRKCIWNVRRTAAGSGQKLKILSPQKTAIFGDFGVLNLSHFNENAKYLNFFLERSTICF